LETGDLVQFEWMVEAIDSDVEEASLVTFASALRVRRMR
jgi:hypothetical protein